VALTSSQVDSRVAEIQRLIGVPVPPRAERRRRARRLNKALERRVKDDAMFDSQQRELSELQKML